MDFEDIHIQLGFELATRELDGDKLMKGAIKVSRRAKQHHSRLLKQIEQEFITSS